MSLNLALLGSAEIQSVTGLDELTGSGGTDLRWLYPVAVIAAIAFVWHERRSDHPLGRPHACSVVATCAPRSSPTSSSARRS